MTRHDITKLRMIIEETFEGYPKVIRPTNEGKNYPGFKALCMTNKVYLVKIETTVTKTTRI